VGGPGAADGALGLAWTFDAEKAPVSRARRWGRGVIRSRVEEDFSARGSIHMDATWERGLLINSKERRLIRGSIVADALRARWLGCIVVAAS
jgi:hypothetical protein